MDESAKCDLFKQIQKHSYSRLGGESNRNKGKRVDGGVSQISGLTKRKVCTGMYFGDLMVFFFFFNFFRVMSDLPECIDILSLYLGSVLKSAFIK